MHYPQGSKHPVAILGAGPVGLAAAAHLALRGRSFLILEAGPRVASNLETVRHVRLFSPWGYNIDAASRQLLTASGWEPPAAAVLPTAGELIDRYLAPLAALPAIGPKLRLSTRVLALSRAGFDKAKTAGRADAPFLVRALGGDCERDFLASAVIDATGTWSHPNPLGGAGLPAAGEAALRAHIAYGMPDVLGAARGRYAGRHVLVAGSGHSAAGNLLALAALAEEAPGTRLTWAIRSRADAALFGGGAADGLPARGELGLRLRALRASGRLTLREDFRIVSVSAGRRGLVVGAAGDIGAIEDVDEIIAATGARPDLALTRELRVRHDPWLESTDLLAPLIDPNEHDCGTVPPHGHRELAHPEPGYYAVGAKSYGRAPNFLLTTGYEQARSVVAAIVGDMPAADDVRLALPDTGVCGSTPGGGCCGGPAPASVAACCLADASAKARGEGGCGCAGPAAPNAPATSGCCG